MSKESRSVNRISRGARTQYRQYCVESALFGAEELNSLHVNIIIFGEGVVIVLRPYGIYQPLCVHDQLLIVVKNVHFLCIATPEQ